MHTDLYSCLHFAPALPSSWPKSALLSLLAPKAMSNKETEELEEGEVKLKRMPHWPLAYRARKPATGSMENGVLVKVM